MQDMTPQLIEGASLITSYGDNGFTIAGTHYNGALCVAPTQVEPWTSSDPFSEAELAKLLAIHPDTEILLIGTGKTHQFIAPAIRKALTARFGTGIETMDTGAACRTFNILLSEGRKVLAALQPL